MLRSWSSRALLIVAIIACRPLAVQAQSCGPNGCGVPAGVPCGPGGCHAPCPQMAGPIHHTGFVGKLSNVWGSLFGSKYCCAPNHNCGRYIFCTPKPPNLRFPYVCGQPVCDPCTLDHYGYYQNCWAPWGFPPDYGHCPTPQLAAVVPAHTPRVEYFSNDIRAQQPNLAADPEGENGNTPRRERERDNDMGRRLQVPVPGTGVDVLPQPRQLGVPVTTPYGR